MVDSMKVFAFVVCVFLDDDFVSLSSTLSVCVFACLHLRLYLTFALYLSLIIDCAFPYLLFDFVSLEEVRGQGQGKGKS